MPQTNSERMTSVSRAFLIARTLFITTVIALSVLIATGKCCYRHITIKNYVILNTDYYFCSHVE